MSRNDVGALRVPGESKERVEARDSREKSALLADDPPDVETAAQAVIPQVEAKPARTSAPIGVCPRCKARLAGVEEKMGRCLSCGKELGPASASSVAGEAGRTGEFVVHI